MSEIKLTSLPTVSNGLRVTVDGESTGAVFVQKGELPVVEGSYVPGESLLYTPSVWGEHWGATQSMHPDAARDIVGAAVNTSGGAELAILPASGVRGPKATRVTVWHGEANVGGGLQLGADISLGLYHDLRSVKEGIGAVLEDGITEEVAPPVETPKRPLARGIAAVATVAAMLVPVATSQAGNMPPQPETTVAGAGTAGEALTDSLGAAPFEADEEVAGAGLASPDFIVTPGMGGEELMTRLGLPPSDWYPVQYYLLGRYPDYFYAMPDGNVGIAHVEPLPSDVQSHIYEIVIPLDGRGVVAAGD